MAAGLEIRAARAEDLDDLLALYRYLNPDDPEPERAHAEGRLAAILAQPGMTILIGRTEGIAASSVTLMIIPNLTRGGASYALIENVVTHADHRKRGHAAALLQHAMEVAWRAGCYKVMLLTGSKDPATLRFYANCGFAQDKAGFQMRRPAGI